MEMLTMNWIMTIGRSASYH